MSEALLNISYARGGIKDTKLINTSMTLRQFTEESCDKLVITDDKLSVPYFCVTTGTRRSAATLDKVAALLIMDCDSSTDTYGNIIKSAPDMMPIHKVLCDFGINHFVHSSHSNNPAEGINKHRVIIEATYVEAELVTLLDYLFKQIHAANIPLVNVVENKDFGRAWFLPSCPADREKYFKMLWYFKGKPLNVQWIMQNHIMPVAEVALPNNRVAITNAPLKTYAVAAEGQTCPIIAFNATYTVIEILLRNGYQQQGLRFLHPNSTSGRSGTRILDSGYVYSDSTHDLLNDGRGHDAFDCYRILECGGNSKVAKAWSKAITAANQAEWRVRNKKTRDFSGLIAQQNVVKSTSAENLVNSQSR
jgi:hypothetical protein